MALLTGQLREVTENGMRGGMDDMLQRATDYSQNNPHKRSTFFHVL